MMSKKFAAGAAVAGALMFAAAPALAVTVTNKSDKAYEVTVDRGAEEPKTKIDPGKTVKLDCGDSCELRGGAFSYGLDVRSGDRAVIDAKGLLAYENASAKPAKSATN